MKRLLLWLILVPLAVIGVAFAVANRQSVDIYFDPFSRGSSAQIAVQLPLFVVIIVALAVGVLVGGLFTWFGQGRHRRALREARAEMGHLRSDVERMKT